MSETKKVPLVSFPSCKAKDKEVENVAKTFRISLDLTTRADEDTCPILYYKEELSSAKRKEKFVKNGIEKDLHKNGLDPFMDDNDDDVRRIAIEMEAKYGVSGAPKKKRKDRRDDYADIGMGYDESDSFIDNTDGYDEIIPQNVTTLHGGFYINCGALEFKTDEDASSINSSSSSSDEDSSDDDETNNKKKNRKRLLTDSEDDDSQKSKKDKAPPIKKSKLTLNGQQKIKKKFLTPDKIKQKKKRILPPPPSVSRNFSTVLEEAPTIAIVSNKPAEDETDNNYKSAKDKDDPVYTKPMSLDNITDIINSVASGQHNNSFVNNFLNFSSPSIANAATLANAIIDIDTVIVDDLDDNVLDESDAFESAPNNVQIDAKAYSKSKVEPMETNEGDVTPLPENLPNDILYLIDAIKQAAATNIANNTSVFSSHVNNLVLSLERKCKCLGKQSQSKIYACLAAFTKCKKDSLVRRAKNLVLQDDNTKLMHNVDLLRRRIEEVMPAIRETYEQMRKHVEMRKMSTEEDTKNLRMPKKTFPWTEEIKRWMRDIYALKRKSFITQGIVAETLDAQLETYFKAEVQSLWPENWISINYLLKVAKNEKKVETIKPTNSVNTKMQPKNTETREGGNINGNSVIRTSGCEVLLVKKHNVTINEPTVKTNSNPLTTKVETTAPSGNSLSNNSLTNPKVLEVLTKVLHKNSENPVTISIPSADRPTLPPTRPISPTVKAEKECCEIVDISTITDHVVASQRKPADRVMTISEILKMQKQRNKDAIVASAARSNSPSLPAPAAAVSTTSCQIIDLTSGETKADVKVKRPGPKCSKVDVKEGTSVSSSATTSLSVPPTIHTATPTPSINHLPPSSTTVNVQQKPINPPDTAEIQKVMEDLKALQQMSYSPSVKSPSTSQQHKPNVESSSATALIQPLPSVSVIALNKNYGNDNVVVGSGGGGQVVKMAAGIDYRSMGETSFQEAFQRQFMASLQQQQQQQSVGSGKSKSNSYNNSHATSSSTSLQAPNKINATSNNNYETNSSSGKVINCTYPAQTQSGYNIMDDMLANFLTEYGYPLTGQKPKQPSQK